MSFLYLSTLVLYDLKISVDLGLKDNDPTIEVYSMEYSYALYKMSKETVIQ
jgi:hypothetical protein